MKTHSCVVDIIVPYLCCCFCVSVFWMFLSYVTFFSLYRVTHNCKQYFRRLCFGQWRWSKLKWFRLGLHTHTHSAVCEIPSGNIVLQKYIVFTLGGEFLSTRVNSVPHLLYSTPLIWETFSTQNTCIFSLLFTEFFSVFSHSIIFVMIGGSVITVLSLIPSLTEYAI